MIGTRIAFNPCLDFLTWVLEKEHLSVPPFEPLQFAEPSQPLITSDHWLAFVQQECLDSGITHYIQLKEAEELFQPLGFSKETLSQLLQAYLPIGNARVFHFLAYTQEKEGHLGEILKLWHLFEPTRVELINLIHWHKPIHCLWHKTLIVGNDLTYFDFEDMDVYLQSLAHMPEFRKEHVGRFARVRTRMTELAILKQALNQLNLTVVEHGEAKANQLSMPCDLVVRLTGDYDIGWTMTDHGTLEMHWDAVGINLTQDAFALVSAINQQYLVLNDR